jgi:hypothetical protein
MDEDICTQHPSRVLEWDGYGLACPSCVLGYPAETDADDQE